MASMLGSALGILVDTIFSKIGEKWFDYTEHSIVEGIKDYNSDFQSLKRILKSLSARATDVEEEIKNAERSGKKKRKREVEDWLVNVKELGDELGTLESKVLSEGFVGIFFGGGQAAEFKERVNQLIKQSRHFGGLVLDVHHPRGEELNRDQELPEAQRADASMVYEANARLRDPVYCCADSICQHQKQVNDLQEQLAKAKAELINMQCQNANLMEIFGMEMSQSCSSLEIRTTSPNYNDDHHSLHNLDSSFLDLKSLLLLFEPAGRDRSFESSEI